MAAISKQHSNIPDNPRWSFDTASREFSCHRDTLRKRLSAGGIEPGEDGCYATVDVVTALFGNLHAARIRKTNEEADNVSLRNSIIRKQMLPADEFEIVLSHFFQIMRQELLGSSIPEDARNSLLSHLSELADTDWDKELGFAP
jgi:hypothetical protein